MRTPAQRAGDPVGAPPRPIASALRGQRVRLITGLITCPLPGCTRPVYYTRIRSGEQWMQCNHERQQRRGSCDCRWLNLTLPASATGRTLAAMVGEDEALALLRLALPEDAGAAALLDRTLAPADGPAYLQIVVRGHDEYLHRWSPLPEILRALAIVSAAA